MGDVSIPHVVPGVALDLSEHICWHSDFEPVQHRFKMLQAQTKWVGLIKIAIQRY